MNREWPENVRELIATLRKSTRESAAELVSVAYSTIPLSEVAVALGFDDEPSLVAYADAGVNPNPAVLTEDFYASYLIVILLAKNLNDARFLWKRIPSDIKQQSTLLANVWSIGKALWKRDFAAAYGEMNREWPESVRELIATLRKSTRESAAELVSVAYSTIPLSEVAVALGFDDETSLVAYCESLGWSVSLSTKLVHPKPLARSVAELSSLQQLESISDYVLHLEQQTTIKL
ncbi:hypothetical protein P43SY_009891 [Pythium insidiosum]|uniref:COP9 signalosome complex subunit 8 n=1 Tax=Pythium insidiosum TaxID=114742 RepID=A0AAD5Q5E2_PYTIN|nr:hypothetical protein P43SY_009891 [Pythium insidiosum]